MHSIVMDLTNIMPVIWNPLPVQAKVAFTAFAALVIGIHYLRNDLRSFFRQRRRPLSKKRISHHRRQGLRH